MGEGMDAFIRIPINVSASLTHGRSRMSGNPQVRICAGGAWRQASLPRLQKEPLEFVRVGDS